MAGALKAMGERGHTASVFTLAYDGFAPEDEGVREALTSTGNGYFRVRGSAEWEDASDVHYPGTYAHGVYNRESTILGRHPIPNVVARKDSAAPCTSEPHFGGTRRPMQSRLRLRVFTDPGWHRAQPLDEETRESG